MQYDPDKTYGGLRRLLAGEPEDRIQNKLAELIACTCHRLQHVAELFPMLAQYVQEYVDSSAFTDAVPPPRGVRRLYPYVLVLGWTPARAGDPPVLTLADGSLTGDWVESFAFALRKKTGLGVVWHDHQFVAPPQEYLDLRQRETRGQRGWSEDSDDEEAALYTQFARALLLHEHREIVAVVILGSAPARHLGIYEMGAPEYDRFDLAELVTSVSAIPHPHGYRPDRKAGGSEIAKGVVHSLFLAMQGIPESWRTELSAVYAAFAESFERRTGIVLPTSEKLAAKTGFDLDESDLDMYDPWFYTYHTGMDSLSRFAPRVRHRVCGKVFVAGARVTLKRRTTRPGGARVTLERRTTRPGGARGNFVIPSVCPRCGGEIKPADVEAVCGHDQVRVLDKEMLDTHKEKGKAGQVAAVIEEL